jgi:toxin ParE1/3/4
MVHRIEWSPRALEDLVAIGEYISVDSKAYAATVVKKIAAVTRQISQFPKAGRIVPEFDDEGIMEQFVYSYRVIYRIQSGSILAVTLIHGDRVIPDESLRNSGESRFSEQAFVSRDRAVRSQKYSWADVHGPRVFIMGLDPSCFRYLDKLLAVRPIYGWGWSRIDAPDIPVPAEVNGVPFPFSVRVQRFFHYEQELRGAVGRIEEPGHLYDAMHLVFFTRLLGTFDLFEHAAHCDIEIGSDEPTGDWPEILTGAPIVRGYGIVGESFTAINDSEQRNSVSKRIC